MVDAVLMYAVVLDEGTDISRIEENDEDSIQVITDYSTGDPEHFVAIKVTVKTAWGGLGPQMVSTPRPIPEWDRRLKAFCRNYGFAYAGPNWLMTVVMEKRKRRRR